MLEGINVNAAANAGNVAAQPADLNASLVQAATEAANGNEAGTAGSWQSLSDRILKSAADLRQRNTATTAHIHAVAAKLRAKAEQIRALKRQRDEAEARMHETLAAEERLRQRYEQELGIHSAQQQELSAQIETLEKGMTERIMAVTEEQNQCLDAVSEALTEIERSLDTIDVS